MGMISVGRIVGPHGIKGEIKIQSFTENPRNLFSFSPLFLGDRPLVKWKNIRSTGKDDIFICFCPELSIVREDIALLKGNLLHISRDQLPLVDHEKEVYYADLPGKIVIDSRGVIRGKVDHVHNFGGGDVLEILFSGKKESIFISFDDVDEIDADSIHLKDFPLDI